MAVVRASSALKNTKAVEYLPCGVYNGHERKTTRIRKERLLSRESEHKPENAADDGASWSLKNRTYHRSDRDSRDDDPRSAVFYGHCAFPLIPRETR